jgi:hypothetical protein
MPPVMVELKMGSAPVSQKTYFILFKAQVRIQKHFDRLLKYGGSSDLVSHPGAPVQKTGTKDFRLVSNPYMLLGLVPAEAKFSHA